MLNYQGKDQLLIKLPCHFVKVKHVNKINHSWIVIHKVVIKSTGRKYGELFCLVLIAERGHPSLSGKYLIMQKVFLHKYFA